MRRLLAFVKILIWVFSFNISAGAIGSVLLENIDVSQMKLVKSSNVGSKRERLVYECEEGDYYKVWPVDYEKSGDFIKALEAEFFDSITPLKAVIYDTLSNCRGYVTQGGVSGEKALSLVMRKTRSGGMRIAELKHQVDQAYKDFYTKLLQTIERTKYAYDDFKPDNIAFVSGQYVLIDLESAEKITGPLCAQLRARIDEFPQDYVEYVNQVWTRP